MDAGQWGPTSQPWPLTVLVDRARPEISLYYDGDRCWIAGTVLNEDGRVVEERLEIFKGRSCSSCSGEACGLPVVTAGV